MNGVGNTAGRTRHGERIGWIAVAVIAALYAAALLALAGRIGFSATGASGGSLLTPYLLRVAGFTLWQALLSTLASIGLGGLTGLALFHAAGTPARSLVLQLFAVPLAVPALVAVLGIVSIYGDNGLLAKLWAQTGLPPWGSIYGLPGLLLAHVFFNLPLVARLVVAALDRIPPETLRLADMLALTPSGRFRHIELPVLRGVLPGAASLVFLLCLTSFAIALTLGGGPQATTIEVALYQALRFDLDFALAVKLAAVECALAAVALLILQSADFTGAEAVAAGHPAARHGAWRRSSIVDRLVGGLAALFVAAPLLAIAGNGLSALSPRLLADVAIWRALATSLAVAAAAAVFAVVTGAALALALASLQRSRGIAGLAFGWAASATLVLPPMLLGAGWFLLLLTWGDPARFAAVAVVIVNGLMATPFAVRLLQAPIRASRAAHDRLAANLGLSRLTRLRLIDGPVLARPLASAALLAMLVSFGDFGAAALFGNENFVTLPMLLYQRFGNYRSHDAAAIALILLTLAFALTALIDRLSRWGAVHASDT